MLNELSTIFDLQDPELEGKIPKERFVKFLLKNTYNLTEVNKMLEKHGLLKENWITIEMFLNMLKPSNTVVPHTVMEQLKRDYSNKDKLIEDR
jgi:Ca2+-binding EF-hand superfamily protein